jgi:hypothetical protein
VQQGNQGGTVRQLTLLDERADLGQRHPLDPVGLGSVRRWTLVGSAAGAEKVMAGVGYPIGGLVGDQRS